MQVQERTPPQQYLFNPLGIAHFRLGSLTALQAAMAGSLLISQRPLTPFFSSDGSNVAMVSLTGLYPCSTEVHVSLRTFIRFKSSS